MAGCDEIEVTKIRPFKDHPFKVLDDDKMHELVESIMVNGVLVPVTVRPIEDGEYEMISGHRRLFAVKEIGLERIPAIVKNYDDDEAVLAIFAILALVNKMWLQLGIFAIIFAAGAVILLMSVHILFWIDILKESLGKCRNE